MTQTVPFHPPSHSAEAGADWGLDTAWNLQAKDLPGAVERAEEQLRRALDHHDLVLTTSGTHALELIAMGSPWGPGDEVIVPSFTHASTANAFLREGASLRFADSQARAPHLDPADVEARVTDRTKAVVVVHYAGGSHGFGELLRLCAERNLLLIEDAAQAFGSTYRGAACGALADGGAISFHETKNLACGEGGLYLAPNRAALDRARIHREMGTNRYQYRTGEQSHYDWQGIGSSYLPATAVAALLERRIAAAARARRERLRLCALYRAGLEELERSERLVLPQFDSDCQPNGHLFFVALQTPEQAASLRASLARADIETHPHYRALHATSFGQRLAPGGKPCSQALRWRDTLLRLPLWPGLRDDQVERVVDHVRQWAKTQPKS